MRGMARIRAKGLTAFTSVETYCNGGDWIDLIGAFEA